MIQERAFGHWQADFRWKDLAIGWAACALDLLAFWNPDATTRPWLVVALGFGGYSILGWQRSRAYLVYGVMFAYGLFAALTFDSYRPTLGLLVALFAISAYGSRRLSYAALVGTLVIDAFWVAEEVRQGAPDRAGTIVVVASVLYALLNFSAFSAGQWRSAQRRFVLESRRREEAETANALNSERTRIASELHDIVAHSVTVIILQAAAARHSMNTDQNVIEKALDNIESSGQRAMIELRRLLSIVHSPDPDPEAPAKAVQRPPGAADIADLLTIMRSVGLRIDFDELGEPVTLDQVVDLAVYRIVQEALTNVAKHAGHGSRVTVAMVWDKDQLGILVSNDVTGRSHHVLSALSSGQGLTNLRERVRVAQGRLEIEASDQRFSIRAALPIASEDDLPRLHRAPTSGGNQSDPGVG